MKMKEFVAVGVATGFFTGFIPGKIIGKRGAGGGLMGSILGFLIVIGFACLFPMPRDWGYGMFLIVILTILVYGIADWSIPIAEKFMLEKWGRRIRHTGEEVDHDFNETNIDEVLGGIISASVIIFLPALSFVAKALLLLITFGVFRYFDVTKKGAVGETEKYYEAKGKITQSIIIDDIICGVYAFLVGLGSFLFFCFLGIKGFP